MLEKEHDVTTFEGATQALDALRSGTSFDVILCDLMMPRMTGIEFRRLAGELDPSLSRKLVFMTGGAFTPETRAFVEDTEATFVEKPFDTAALRKVVNGLIT